VKPLLEILGRLTRISGMGLWGMKMKKVASRAIWVAICSTFVAVFVAWTGRRFDPCEPVANWRLCMPAAPGADSPAPTPAPPRALVVVQVQTDRPDLEVGWAENH
jgi:hypothetical protein